MFQSVKQSPWYCSNFGSNSEWWTAYHSWFHVISSRLIIFRYMRMILSVFYIQLKAIFNWDLSIPCCLISSIFFSVSRFDILKICLFIYIQWSRFLNFVYYVISVLVYKINKFLCYLFIRVYPSWHLSSNSTNPIDWTLLITVKSKCLITSFILYVHYRLFSLFACTKLTNILIARNIWELEFNFLYS